MPLIYACVANKDIILAEHATKVLLSQLSEIIYSQAGNFTRVVKRILEQIPEQDGRMSYVFERCPLYPLATISFQPLFPLHG